MNAKNKTFSPKETLSTPVQFVKGVGPALAQKLRRLNIASVGDLFFLLPHRYLDRRKRSNIAEVPPGKDQSVIGTVMAAGIGFLGARQKRVYEVVVEDDTGLLTAIWFHFHLPYMQKVFHVGDKILLAGEITIFGRKKQIVHPDVEKIVDEQSLKEVSGRILPVYPLTEGLYQKTLRKIIRNAWEKYGEMILHRREELKQIHFPPQDADVDSYNNFRSPAHQTLIYDEFFLLELGLALKRRNTILEEGIIIPTNFEFHKKFLNTLPFSLTHNQETVLEEIFQDLKNKQPMHRLLQGDVGSGKTVVAACGLGQAVASGAQGCLMVPTEILAGQHFQTLKRMFDPLKIPVALLTSDIKGKEREKIYQGLQSGEIPIVVGTHAILEEGVQFSKLGFVVIDEQHRFGVLQKQLLQKKGPKPNVLIMTATPIPRTLAMTLYGDLDVSTLREKPVGRKPIITKLYSERGREKLYQGMKIELKKEHQIYVVYPLIEESEKMDLKDATQMFEEIKNVFPEYSVALLHGRLPSEKKEAVMKEFQDQKIQILVATMVVEVGLDIPKATVMVIEHAERFGLSQLHQLRGRVGRSEKQSYCVLMMDWKRSEEAEKRLQVMVESNDGFRIAEEDLNIRGPGEFIGTRQSGLPEFRVANLARDLDILQKARDEAFALVEKDPDFTRPEHIPLKALLEERWKGKLGLAGVA